MYEPSEDSWLLQRVARRRSGEVAVDTCTGTGIIAHALMEGFDEVIGVDVDEESIAYAREQCPGPDYRVGDTLRPVEKRVDLITCNPPYLPPEDLELVDRELESSRAGVGFSMKLLDQAHRVLKPGGAVLFIASSRADLDSLKRHAIDTGWELDVCDSEKHFFETLFVYEATLRKHTA